MGEKEYTVEDVRNIIRQEQERWEALTKIDIIYSVHGKDRIVYNIVRTIQGANGVAIQIEV